MTIHREVLIVTATGEFNVSRVLRPWQCNMNLIITSYVSVKTSMKLLASDRLRIPGVTIKLAHNIENFRCHISWLFLPYSGSIWW